MFQTQLINAVLDWERRLEIEDEKRKNHRYEPYVNYLAEPQRPPQERKSILAWVLNLAKGRQPVHHCYAHHEHCQET